MRNLGLVVVVAAVAACGHGGYPDKVTIDFDRPLDGAVIGSHEYLYIDATVHGGRLRDLRLSVDGEPVETSMPDDTPLGSCDPCAYTLEWDTTTRGLGPATLTLSGYGDGEEPIGESDAHVVFDDVPELLYFQPDHTLDYTGVGTLEVRTRVFERGATTASIELDGVAVVSEQHPDCKAGCLLSYDWDTSALPAGPHEVRFAASDDAGHSVEERRVVTLDDMMMLNGIEVTNLPGILELELYVIDDQTTMLLGCVGSAHGLDVANSDDTFYPLMIEMVDPDGKQLGMLDTMGHPFHLEVWEDDDPPICPTRPDPMGNNLVGTSSSRTAEQWKGSSDNMFGDVTKLQLNVGRPRSR